MATGDFHYDRRIVPELGEANLNYPAVPLSHPLIRHYLKVNTL
jgi:hypothetical protein